MNNSVSNRDASPADPVVDRWVARTLARDPPRAKSLLVTAWGDALAPHGGEVWLAGLIRLLAPLRLNERLVRTSVFRLAREGWLAARTHGRRSRYRLTSAGAARFDQAYRLIYHRPDDDWDGRWVVVLADQALAAGRARLRDELRWAGFGDLGPNTFLRPQRANEALPSILASRAGKAALTLSASEVPDGPPAARVAAAAWDLSRLARDYRRFLVRFGAVIERFGTDGGPNAEQCFVVRTLLIHAYRRVLLRDPLLPAALLPLDWPGAAAYALCQDFYRRTHSRAERHLAGVLAEGGEPWPPADASFYDRFGGLTA